MNTKAATLAATALLALAAITGCGSSAPVGEPTVHEKIKAETNCDKLQADFDRHVDNHKRASDQGKLELTKAVTSYMDTTFKRQEELKCFG